MAGFPLESPTGFQFSPRTTVSAGQQPYTMAPAPSGGDDQPALQALLNLGAIVALQNTSVPYQIATPLRMTPNSGIVSQQAPVWLLSSSTQRSIIKARAGFVGAALIEVWDKSLTGASVQPTSGLLEKFVVDGNNNLAGPVDGISFLGAANDWTLNRVSVQNVSGYGFRSESSGANASQELNYDRCYAHGCTLDGFHFDQNSYDHTISFCVSISNGGHGYYFGVGTSSIQVNESRAEFNNLDGFRNLGGAHIPHIACTTDHNKQNGFYVSKVDETMQMYVGCIANRDGSADLTSDYSGFYVTKGGLASCGPVMLLGCVTKYASNDNSFGAMAPRYGISADNCTALMIGGYYEGLHFGLNDKGGNVITFLPGMGRQRAVTIALAGNGGSVSAGAATINVTSTTGFTASGSLQIENERITYTGITGTSFTGCTRGTNGTTAASHNDGVLAAQWASNSIVSWIGRIDGGGQLHLPDSGSAGGIAIGATPMQFYEQATNVARFSGGSLEWLGSVAGDTALASFISGVGHSFDNWQILRDGSHIWSDGNVNSDTQLKRDAAGVLYIGNTTRYQSNSSAQTGGGTKTIDTTRGRQAVITVNDATAFTVSTSNNPSNSETAELVVKVLNNTGGAIGAITWDATFVFAGFTWTNPGSFGRRMARFVWDTGHWVCTSVSLADF